MEKLLRTISLHLIPAVSLLLLTACSGGSGDRAGRWANNGGNCLANAGKEQVLDIMQYWYLWNDEADQLNKYRNLDLEDFGDAEELLDFLRYQPAEFDRGFSYITTPEEEQAFFGEGQFIGFGFSMAFVDNAIRFSQVFDGSPADAAGFQRGYRLVAINGRDISTFQSGEEFAAAFGPEEVGFSVSFTVEDNTGTELPPVSLTKALVAIDPVPQFVTTQDSGGNDVAYVQFNSFISSASAALRSTFDDIAMLGIDRIVIDLRYNGGGLVSVAEVLASLLAGPGHVGEVFNMYRFNSDRAAEYDESVDFQSVPEAVIDFQKIVFITSEGSASASELVINGLKPYFSGTDLAVVGSPTYGKPVGQFGFDFCNDDYRLRAVTFKSVNADGNGDYFDGLPVDCQAEDDLSLPLGNANEASFAAALEYMGSGSCPMSVAPGFGISGAKAKSARARPVFGPTLAQQYAGAF